MVTKKRAALPKLPKLIRDEIRMTCALKGFSNLIQGKGKNRNQQYDQMYIFYHGKKPHRPSQIRMLCNGQGSYRDMYDSSQVMVTSKSGDTESVTRLYLKPSLHLDLNTDYRADYDLLSEDLERKTVNNPLLITGRSLHALAKKGITHYRKALSFASKKWDLKKNEPKESGCTSADVIDFVRREMYNEMYDIPRDDTDSDEEEDYSELNEVDNDTIGNTKNGDVFGDDGDDTNDDDEDTATKTNPKSPLPTKLQKSTSSTKSSSEKRNPDDDIPNNWFFPGFFSFVIYGPFANASDRLACYEINDSAIAASRASKRKADLLDKEKKRSNDDFNKRGFTTDQKISIEALNLQRLAHEQTTNESNLVALIAHESALGRQIEAAERRAFIRCKDYDASNIFWKNCDSLITKQAEITENIAKYTRNINPVTIRNQTNEDSEMQKSMVDLLGSDSESDSIVAKNKRSSSMNKKEGK